jgi:ATP-dependent DNA helicase RecG
LTGSEKKVTKKPTAHEGAAPVSKSASASGSGGSKGAPQKALEKLNLRRDIDLALHLPLRYEDETRITKLAEAREGDTAQIEGEVTACEVAYRPRRQLLVTVNDGSDSCVLRFFNFYPSQQKALAVGTKIRARGELSGGFLGWTMVHPQCKAASGALPTALTPVYPTVAGLPQPYLRKAVLSGLTRAELSDTLPTEVAARLKLRPLWTLKQALEFLHHPTPDVMLAQLEDRTHPAWQRLKAEELLAQQLSQLQSRREREHLRAPVLVPVRPELVEGPFDRAQPERMLPLHEQLLAALPFQLTGAQRRVSEELARDLAQHQPMHRLLQGDVGSGKTVVAALAATICMDAGWQCALMAPTEILADQHFRKLVGWLEPLGVRVAWLTGSQKKKERAEMLGLIERGEAGLVVGTHAVIQEQVQFKNLALAIIDEQHRFGVAQRLALRGKTNSSTVHPELVEGSAQASTGSARTDEVEPHLLMMTATPIPRTLAMSYYADLDVSTIDELPPGRSPIVTKVVSEQRRDEVIQRIRGQLEQGRQVYWVCPLIEESEMLDLTNATETYAELSAALNDPHAPPLRGALSPEGAAPALGPPGGRGAGVMVGLLHSRMPVAEKKAVMSLFTGGQMGVLVSTTVIEVGVDVPNATLMVIEHAERFGLSQLHQLRGRVGRGAAASACVLLFSTGDAPRLGETARERLKAMAETNDGFEIARRDLDIRGPGEFLGARQSGAALLRFADLTEDSQLLAWAREAAPVMLDRHPALAERHVLRWLGSRTNYLKA